MTEKLKVFVGTDVNGGCAECQMVFEYSLKKHCSVPYEIVWMKISDDPNSFWNGWNTDRWSTPFSGFRYGIAEYCNFEGKAIYCDDDQLWLDDPLKLWNIKIPDDKVMTGKILSNGEIRHCVSLIDCAKWTQFPKSSRIKQFDNFTDRMKSLTFPKTYIISDTWNCYDGENMQIEDIQLLHFTDMSSNPGVKLAVKRLGSQSEHWYDGIVRTHRRQDIVDIFMKYYNEALENGFSVMDYVPNRKITYKKQTQKNYIANNGYDVTQGQ